MSSWSNDNLQWETEAVREAAAPLLCPPQSHLVNIKLKLYHISVYELGRLRTLLFDTSFIPLLDLKPLHVSAVL
jgi:hypothetical protein